MSIFQSRILFWPRQIFKLSLQLIYPLFIKVWTLPLVLSIEETLDKILNDNCSISRFGDGEILFIIHKVNLPFQKYEPELRKKMINILKSKDENILVGLPIGYFSIDNLTKKSKLTWTSHIVWTYPRLRKYLDLSKTYYNASITRPYVNYKNKSKCAKYFEKLMTIWEGREILLVEGEKSRLGVGNNLFQRALRVERILAPPINAFSKYMELLDFAKSNNKSKLVLLALGPTATIMAYDLAMDGFQVLDVGNVDIEYEWFLRGVNEKVKIPGKYSNEVPGGCDVEDINNLEYQNQIIKRLI